MALLDKRRRYAEKVASTPVLGLNWLKFTAIAAGTFTLTIPANVTTNYITNISYSTDNGLSWTTTNNANSNVVITTPTIAAGDSVLWKGNAVSTALGDADGYHSSFSSSEEFSVSGNIVSLLYGDNFTDTTILSADYAFSALFKDCTKLISMESLLAPTIRKRCYASMFQGCTSLTTAPTIYATTITGEYNCYNMFYGCTSLTTAPTICATNLADNCFAFMFRDCTSLTTAPTLPATTLANHCYYAMFWGCTSLTTAPVLNSTNLETYCYGSMFDGCTSLTTAPALPAVTLKEGCYYSMFNGCTRLTTAPTLLTTTLAERCYQYMFQGCTNLTTAPKLPATILKNNCYNAMFWGCTSLETAPILYAKTLINGCYKYMFYGCNKLQYIKAMFTTTPGTSFTGYWVTGVAASGTFVKNRSATWNVTGVNGIPSGWGVATASS